MGKYTAEELEKMIHDYVEYWSDPLGKGDMDVAAANRLKQEALPIAQQLLAVLKKEQ
ncbi:hypothetical protein KOM00_20305 [Geomonas sp. Red69]|uniref:hypothetical protein n=1 Tax=Geomonas diazotrophica TaxID=2843197 RepID=UPI001C0F6BF4|nr:hypothetical protein [Geomonas diazotrophica]MBU5639068.1 hypothetical protein [Geomonas diazotrophica]